LLLKHPEQIGSDEQKAKCAAKEKAGAPPGEANYITFGVKSE